MIRTPYRGANFVELGPYKFTEILHVNMISSDRGTTVLISTQLFMNHTLQSVAAFVYAWSPSSPDTVRITVAQAYPVTWSETTSVPLSDLLTPAGTVFTDAIPDHVAAREPATAKDTDWSWSCGWLGCAMSFTKGEGDLLNYLLSISGGGLGAIIAVLAYFEILGALAATVAGIIIVLRLAYIATLDYFCTGGYWLGYYYWGGMVRGCNPVPSYL